MVDQYSKRNETYKAYGDWLFEEFNKAIDSFIVGNVPDKALGIWNLSFFLMQMRNESYTSCRPSAEMIRCLSQKVICHGVDIRMMEEIWPPSYDDDCPGDTCTGGELCPDGSNPPCDEGGGGDDCPDGTPAPCDGGGFKNDGINYMQIQADSSEHPIFRINKL